MRQHYTLTEVAGSEISISTSWVGRIEDHGELRFAGNGHSWILVAHNGAGGEAIEIQVALARCSGGSEKGESENEFHAVNFVRSVKMC